MQYSVHGAVQAMKLGNGLWEHANFNSRLQLIQIGLGTASTDSSKMKLDYAYGVIEGEVLNPTKNNGNIQSQILTMPGLVLNQKYLYDELNRLKSAEELNGGPQVWKQTFSYDRFGNRRFDAANTTLPQIPQPDDPHTNPTISGTNNRLSAAGYRYDLAGNLECDPTHPCGSTVPFLAYYEYNGENKLRTANGGASNGGSTYSYDGDGQRVKKIVGGSTTIITVYVYDIAGQLIAEYSDQPPTAGGTSYLTADHLGTPRVITRADGTVSGRHDYQPFGEEIPATSGGRGNVTGYPPSDSLRQQFTSKERDNETELDFSAARYYMSIQGRFTSPDPLLSSGRVTQPQSWNRYSYVINRPLRLVDPTGLDWGVTEWTEDGVLHRNYHWFNGEVGSHDGKNYTRVSFGKSGHLDINAIDGTVVRISNRGIIRQVIYRPPGRTGTGGDGGETLSIGAGLANSAARALASLAPNGTVNGIPVGLIAEHSFESIAGVDPHSAAYQNGQLLGEGLILAAMAAVPIPRINSPEYILWTKRLAFNEFEATLLAGGGDIIAGAGSTRALRDAPRLAAQYGGNAADWAKVTSRSFEAADGAVIAAHAYKNVATGKVVEVKGIIDKFPVK
jgi:RHS repeat-associated protein